MPELYYDGQKQPEEFSEATASSDSAGVLVESNFTSCMVLPPAGIHNVTIKLYPQRTFYTKVFVKVHLQGNSINCGASDFQMIASLSDEEITHAICISRPPIFIDNYTQCTFECICTIQCYVIYLHVLSHSRPICEITVDKF